MDSRALSVTEQAKNVRRTAPPFTWHSQLFHKHQFCARTKIFLLFPSILAGKFLPEIALH
jgi:hypothetical protein